ncbi:MAG: TAXI family TRAP transporter solute-binding subunit [Alphaproteobacteria bacterium]
MTRWRAMAMGIVGSAVAAWGLMAASAHAASEPAHDLIVCDDLGSPAHALGIGLELLVKLELMPTTGIDVAASASSGRADCLMTMEDKASAFAILDSTIVESPPEDLRFSGDGPKTRPLLVASLWRQAAQFLIARNQRLSGTIGDFALLSDDQRVIDPALRDGAALLLAMAGITIDRRTDGMPMKTPDALTESFNRGATIGFAVLEPVPSPTVTEFLAKTGGRAVMLELSQRYLEADDTGWRPLLIPAFSYPDISRPVETFGNTVMLVAEADVADETVYQVTKIMFNNLPKLRQVDDIATQISIDRALDDTDLPLHPGAARYYREIGVLPYEAGASKVDRVSD